MYFSVELMFYCLSYIVLYSTAAEEKGADYRRSIYNPGFESCWCVSLYTYVLGTSVELICVVGTW